MPDKQSLTADSMTYESQSEHDTASTSLQPNCSMQIAGAAMKQHLTQKTFMWREGLPLCPRCDKKARCKLQADLFCWVRLCALLDAACQTELLSIMVVLSTLEGFVHRWACSGFTAHAICSYIVDMSIPVSRH